MAAALSAINGVARALRVRCATIVVCTPSTAEQAHRSPRELPSRTLDLPARKTWLPAIKSNLRVTLELAAAVSAFELSDDAEPAPVFRA